MGFVNRQPSRIAIKVKQKYAVMGTRYKQNALFDPPGWKAFWKTFILQVDKHNILEPFDLSVISLETFFSQFLMILYVISSTKVEADWQATSKLFIQWEKQEN